MVNKNDASENFVPAVNFMKEAGLPDEVIQEAIERDNQGLTKKSLHSKPDESNSTSYFHSTVDLETIFDTAEKYSEVSCVWQPDLLFIDFIEEELKKESSINDLRTGALRCSCGEGQISLPNIIQHMKMGKDVCSRMLYFSLYLIFDNRKKFEAWKNDRI